MTHFELRSIPRVQNKFVNLDVLINGKIKVFANEICLTEEGIKIDLVGSPYLPPLKIGETFSFEAEDAFFNLKASGAFYLQWSLTAAHATAPEIIILEKDTVGRPIKIKRPNEVYDFLQMPAGCGEYFDQFGERSINTMDDLWTGARLYCLPSSSVLGFCTTYSRFPVGGMSYQAMNPKSHDLRVILSLAVGGRVSLVARCVCDDSFNQRIHWYGSRSEQSKPSLYIAYPGEIQIFLNGATRAWNPLESQVGLPFLIDYWVQIRRQHIVDVKYVLISVFLETLKDQFARNVRQYQRARGGGFLESPRKHHVILDRLGLARAASLIPRLRRRKLSFRALLGDAIQHYGIAIEATELDRLIEIRNRVIHTGMWSDNISKKISSMKIHEQAVQRILLTLVGFEGLWFSRVTFRWEKFVK